jgi:aspartate-semialdehyde dehydrogenase
MKRDIGYRIALVGSQSLQGKEMKNVLEKKAIPLAEMDFYDPDVEEEYSKLTQFRGEPKVIRHLDKNSLLGFDLAFLASDQRISQKYGQIAAQNDIWTIDLGGTFNSEKRIPIVVAGVNDGVLHKAKPGLVANPHPVTIILSHLIHLLIPNFGFEGGVAFICQPVSAFDNSGIEELANQCYDALQGGSIQKEVFKTQIAFNLLSHAGEGGEEEFALLEDRIVEEIKRVLDSPKLPLNLSVIQTPVFFTYSIMIRFELAKKASIQDLADLFDESSYFEYTPPTPSCQISAVSVTGKDTIHIGRIKQERFHPDSFWVWAIADNLTRGSALNAYELAEAILSFAIS